MKYKQCTKRLKIPVHGLGDHLWPETEMQRFQIIENMLLAGTKGVRNCVFDDGMFRLNPETETTYVATLQATGHSPSAIGMIAGAYFEAPPIITWSGLKKGYFYFLYLRGTSNTFENFNEVNPIFSSFTLEGDNLLMATADCRSEQPKLEPYPDGKLYSGDLAQHVNDVENPHGRELLQDVLYVREKLALYSPEGYPATVEVLIDGKPVEFPSSALPDAVAEIAGRKVVTVDFTSNGSTGRVIEMKDAGTILFVQASQRFDGKALKSLGDVAIGYFGEDQQIHLPNEFSFYNSGDSDVLIRALVYCR
jgi:hypothetical protein